MSDYSQSTFFAPKDSLSSGDPLKIIKGSEVDAELSSISAAIATKVDTGGDGIALSGTTAALDLNSLAAVTPVTADEFGFADASDSNNSKKVTFGNLATALESEMNHDNMTGFVANEHVDHSSVSITAGTGLSGGGDLTSTRTINLDINGLTDTSYSSSDQIAVYDASATAVRRINLSEIDHDSLTGFVSNEHVDHSSVSITSGNGLTGGGTITSSRTLNVGSGTGITVNANDVAVSGNVLRHNTSGLSSAGITVQSGGSPSGGSNGDIYLIY